MENRKVENYNPYFQIIDGRPVITDVERLKKDWDESDRNIKFLVSNYEMLLDRYPDQWIAIYDEKVLASDTTQKGLLRKLDELDIRRKGAVTEFLQTNPTPLIL